MRVSSLGLDLWRYRVVEADFEVPVRYDIVESVGEGTFGKVCAAKDLHTRKLVAIKKIENSFEYLSMAMRTLRELRILRNMRHENVMGVRNVFVVDGKDTFEDVYVVSDLMEVDLATLIRSSQPLLEEQVQFFLYQVLRGMKYIHSAGVIHRDLKPRNLLVNSNCALKIADFGLSRLQDSAGMTQYVCTRWYRAPEVLCAWENYTQAVDVWSIGCIFAEMLLRRPLFPADNTADMLKRVVSLLGYPGVEDMRRIPNERCRSFIRSLPRGLGQDFSQMFPTAMPAAIEFLSEVLRFGPDERPTVAEALELPYMERFFDPEDEPVRGPLDPSDFEFEGRMLDASALREELFLEVLHYHPQKYQEYMREQAALGHRRHDITRYRFLVGEETVDSLDSWN